MVGIGLTYLLGWSSVFVVEKVTITGTPSESVRAHINKISDIEIGEKLARVNPSSSERKISKIAWIKGVSISRNWFSGEITVAITSREPLAFFNNEQVPGQTIDKDGVLFVLPGYVNDELALISAKSPQSALKANELFINLPAEFRSSISSMVATSDNTFTLVKEKENRSIRIRWGDSSEVTLKIAVIEKLLNLPENEGISLIDVVAPHAPIVK
ncbi:MAG: cell division protein FtsQ/DivIB [Candidatus Planktophila sp.]